MAHHTGVLIVSRRCLSPVLLQARGPVGGGLGSNIFSTRSYMFEPSPPPTGCASPLSHDWTFKLCMKIPWLQDMGGGEIRGGERGQVYCEFVMRPWSYAPLFYAAQSTLFGFSKIEIRVPMSLLKSVMTESRSWLMIRITRDTECIITPTATVLWPYHTGSLGYIYSLLKI